MQSMSLLPITIWMNVPSFYQGELFRDLVKLDHIDLFVVYAQSLPESRKQLGWEDDRNGYPSVTLSDTPGLKRSAVQFAWQQSNRFHIVNGLWAEPAFSLALLVLSLTKADFAIYSEASSPLKSRHWLKIVSRKIFSSLILNTTKGVLPVGTLGVNFFRSLGIPEEKIYPFGYFRQAVSQSDCFEDSSFDGLRLIFVGQFIERKGVDLLLDAVAALVSKSGANIQLTLIGEGSQQNQYEQQVVYYDLQGYVSFTGVISSPEILKHICQADALVLPSRWDGWGLVVNEALSVGVPVLVSDACGAADLIVDGVNGYVFAASEVNSLEQTIAHMLENRASWSLMRVNAKKVGQNISTEVMARYLVACIKHMRGQNLKRPALSWLSGIEDKSL